MRYANIDFAVKYVDPSKSASGDGSTPADAMNALPANADGLDDATCYLVRRTAESKSAKLPAGRNSAVRSLLLLGMPNADDRLYQLVPAEARAAWGADSARYANVRSENTSTTLELPSARVFLMHRVYLFRNDIAADGYILKFDDDGHAGCIAFEHCRFGSLGVDLDRASYATALTASRCKAYVSVETARVLSVVDCDVVHAATGNSSSGHGIRCGFADILDVEDVRVHSACGTTYSSCYPLMLSERSDDGVECLVRNVSQTIRLNGAQGTRLPPLLSLQGYVSCEVEGVSVRMGQPLASNMPASMSVDAPCVSVVGAKELSVGNVDIDVPVVWSCAQPLLRIERCESGNDVPGIVKGVSGVRIRCAGEDGIGTPPSYSSATQEGSYYAAFVCSFEDGGRAAPPKTPQVYAVEVDCPRGKAAYFEGVTLTESSFKGTLVLERTIADVDSIETWYPGRCLHATEGSHVHVGRIAVNLENPSYPYTEDAAVASAILDGGNVFVDESNARLAPMNASSSSGAEAWHGIGCNNEGAEGHFAMRGENTLCDTWSVRRAGGGAAALKLWNNFRGDAGTMVLGRRPFGGMLLAPQAAGLYMLRAHVAYKGFATPADLNRHLVVSATSGGRRYYSSVHGRWADDQGSTWVNDDALGQLVLEMPVEVDEDGQVDVRVYFSWYSGGGFVYFDPAVELVEL